MTNLLRLDRNEPSAIARGPLTTYPEIERLASEIARFHNVKTRNVLPTPGADGALDIAFRSVRGTGVLLDPDFPRYAQHARNAGLVVTTVPVSPSAVFPADSLLQAVGAHVGIVVVSTVGNPMGYRLPHDFVPKLRDAAPQALLVIDETYSPFVGTDLTGYAVTTPNVISIRTLSKLGLPGIRVGWALGEPETLDRLRQFASPVAVAGPSIDIAIDALRHPERGMRAIRRQAAARMWLENKLRALGFCVMPSPANFELRDVPLPALVKATGLSKAHCSLIKRGLRVPHPRHWEALEALAEGNAHETNGRDGAPAPLR